MANKKKRKSSGVMAKFNIQPTKLKVGSNSKSISAGSASGKKAKGSKSEQPPKLKVESKAGKQVSGSKLNEVRKMLQPMLNRANRAIDRLKASGDYDYSAAIAEAARTKSRAKGISDNLFDLSDKKRYRDLMRGADRLLAFLSHPEVEPKVAKYNRSYGSSLSFHDASIRDSEDQDRVKLALRIYRDIASTETSAIGRDAYGSDNLLNLIYDELDDYNPYMGEDAEDILTDSVRMIAFDALDDYYENVTLGFLSGRPNVTYENNSERDMGLVTELKKSESVDAFLKRKNRIARKYKLDNDW